jgi:hypothetical protein
MPSMNSILVFYNTNAPITALYFVVHIGESLPFLLIKKIFQAWPLQKSFSKIATGL